LQVFVDIEIVVEGLKTPADQQKLEGALAALPGIKSLNFVEKRIAIRYDPETVTKAKLCALIAEAGFQVTDVESASVSPSVYPHGNL
jgi:hypothetical protein